MVTLTFEEGAAERLLQGPAYQLSVHHHRRLGRNLEQVLLLWTKLDLNKSQKRKVASRLRVAVGTHTQTLTRLRNFTSRVGGTRGIGVGERKNVKRKVVAF